MVDAERAIRLGREQLQHAAGAGADVEQTADGPLADRLTDRRLDRFLGDVHGAQVIPVGGVGLEVRGRRPGARAAHLVEPRPVGQQHGIVARDGIDDLPRQTRGGGDLRHEQEHPGALAVALDEAGLDEQLEVPGDARLRLPEDGDEFADGELGVA